MAAAPNATPTASSTSGSSAIAGASSVGIVAPLKSSCRTTRSPVNVVSTASSIDALMEAPNVVNRATTAVPTIRAEALDAMRRGLRIALRRARRPVKPRVDAGARAEHGGRRAGDHRSEDDGADEHAEGTEAGAAERAVVGRSWP